MLFFNLKTLKRNTAFFQKIVALYSVDDGAKLKATIVFVVHDYPGKTFSLL